MTVDESGGQSSSHGQPASKIRMASSASGSVASSGGSGGNGGGGGGLAPSTSPSNTGEIHHHPHHQHHRPQLHHPVPVAGTAVGAGQQQMPATAVAPGKSPPTSGQTAAATMTFERFLKMQPAKAEQALEQLIEVTGTGRIENKCLEFALNFNVVQTAVLSRLPFVSSLPFLRDSSLEFGLRRISDIVKIIAIFTPIGKMFEINGRSSL